MSAAVEVARDITGGIAEGVQDVGRAAGSAASSAIATVRGVTGGAYDAIGAAAQKVGNTVEAVLNNPKALAAVAISIAFPAAAPALGEWILGAELAASVGAAGTAAVGNMCLNTAMNGGDVGQAVKTTALQYAGNIGSAKLTEIVKNADLVPDAFAKNIGDTTTYAAIQAAQGKDPTVALLTGGANACAQLLVQEVPGFSEMPKDVQTAVTKATASALQGKSGGAVNAAIDFATKFAKDEYNSYKDANDNGFGYDPTSWKDAKAIGITDPTDYKYAKEIGASDPYDLQVGKAIGAKDNFDLQLAKDIGLSTADEFNYAKQVGVNNKDDYDLAKNVGAQSGVDVTYAKDLGLDTAKDFNYARNVGVNTVDDFNLAKNVGAQKIGDVDYAKLLGIDNSDDFNYAKKVGATTVEDFGLANQTGAKDATDLDVAKQFGITDKDTLNQYSDFLGHGTEKASTTTIKGQDGTELTIDNEGNLVKYTYDQDGKQQDITDEVQKVASRAGGYTIRGDDGSTLTVNPDGTVSATEAPEDYFAQPGAKKSPVSYARLVGEALKNRSATQQTQQGGINEATVEATKRMQASPYNKTGYQITQEDIASILPLFLGEEQTYTPQETSEGEPTGAQVEVGGPEGSQIDYLANLGGKPSYLGSLERTQATEGAQVEPGKDAGAASRGAVSGPPVGTGGGGSGYDRYTSTGPVVGGGGGAGYSQSSAKAPGQDFQDLIQSLRDSGLQDQSDAETARLLSAQGPVAIGRVPARATGLPALPAKVADINTLPSGEQITPPATLAQMPSFDPTEQIKKLQEYAAALKSYDPTEQLKALQSYASMFSGGSRQAKQQGTTAYKDMFGNIRTR